MSSPAPHVYSIPPGVPFVDALAAQLLRETAADPLALSRMTVLLPTRRAVRSLREAFLRCSEGKALLLPTLTPIGDIDEEALAFAPEAGPLAAAAAELPPAIPELRRRLLLAELILKLKGLSLTHAVQLAGELGRLIDQVATERIGFEGLAGLVPVRYAAHWQITLAFLRIVTEHWPKVLAEEGALDPAERRNRVLAAQGSLWRRHPPADPVIAAGSTGSIPATADLLALVASLPTGRVVLPGLDRHTDADAWERLAPSHPQFGLRQLLGHLGLARQDVADWPWQGALSSPPARAALIAEAMRPAGSTDAWRRRETLPEEALRGLARIDCPTPREEARVIALRLREALETPVLTAALVTPDRALARRVAAELKRWDVEVDDSAGTPLAATPPGTFLRLLAEAAAERLAPLPLVALLKHPLAAGGEEPPTFRQAARLLERHLLRGPRPAAGIRGLRAAVRRLGDGEVRKTLSKLIDCLEEALAPLLKLLGRRAIAAAQAVAAHIAAAEALAATRQRSGAAALWAGEAGEAAALFVDELALAARRIGRLEGGSYPAFFATLLDERVVRPRYGRHPRLFIWGPLEARLQHADLVILAGLNEGTWPPAPTIDPWMSRPMRATFGLPEAERRIGLSAHDFAQAAAAREVVLTRALKVDGTPSVPARWLLRLDALLAAGGVALETATPARWLGWQKKLDEAPGPPAPSAPPAPRPPLAARPRRLSVTEIETWMRDPYGIYARHVLGLKALEPLDADPGAAERGSFIHAALDRFVREFADALPGDALAELLRIGTAAFGPALERPGVRAFWWPRFERVAAWFVEREGQRRALLAGSRTEVRGLMTLATRGEPFLLAAKADRIDRLQAGGLVIIDYKTGRLPHPAEVAAGLAPQLPLEAAMALAGAFREVPGEAVAELAFWRLSGGTPAGEECRIEGDVQELARSARAGLLALIERFDDEATPYAARPRPEVGPAFSDYEHLARVKEWSAGGASSGEGGP
jgi:ATP-dependent helicase/nuclease subunit B